MTIYLVVNINGDFTEKIYYNKKEAQFAAKMREMITNIPCTLISIKLK